MGRGDHAPCHRFSVQQLRIARLRFECVADGVAEIEHLPQTALAFVGAHDRRFQTDGIGNDLFYHGGIAIKNLAAAVFKHAEQPRISDDSAFERLVEAGAIFAGRQRRQHGGIDEHGTRLMERAEQVLAGHGD